MHLFISNYYYRCRSYRHFQLTRGYVCAAELSKSEDIPKLANCPNGDANSQRPQSFVSSICLEKDVLFNCSRCFYTYLDKRFETVFGHMCLFNAYTHSPSTVVINLLKEIKLDFE